MEQKTRTDAECLEIIRKDWPEYLTSAEMIIREKEPLEPFLSVLESFG